MLLDFRASRDKRVRIPFRPAPPSDWSERLLIAVDTWGYHEDHVYHIMDHGEYVGGHTYFDAEKLLIEEYGLRQKIASTLLHFARSHRSAALSLDTNEMIGDCWELSKVLPDAVWTEVLDR